MQIALIKSRLLMTPRATKLPSIFWCGQASSHYFGDGNVRNPRPYGIPQRSIDLASTAIGNV